MKLLILVQGISKTPYLKKELHQVGLGQVYDRVVLAPTESVFDDSLVSKLPLMDKHGDWFQFFTNEKQRIQAARRVTKIIRAAEAMGYTTIDILSHSLGTLISITAKGSIRNLACLGSPLSFSVPGIREYILNYTKKYKNLRIKNRIIYAWSPKDFVCNVYDKKIEMLFAPNQPTSVRSTSKHDSLDYLQDIISTLGVDNLIS